MNNAKNRALLAAAEGLEDLALDIWHGTAAAVAAPVRELRGPLHETFDGPQVLIASYIVSWPITAPLTSAAWLIRRALPKKE